VIETYIPLYRKYRPQQFSDLVGQEVIATAVGNALALNKIAHAYLFCGPRGTGKTSSARIFAKSLNCVQGPTSTPCQTCPSCVAITQGNALDVTEIDAASNNGVDHIRELTEKVQFSAIEGKFKVYIIDEVHMLSTAAFNALLKTLEEPPPNVVFVFATTEAHKVLPTIISRCQRFDFSRITRQQIESRVLQVAELEGIRIHPDAVTLIARHVRGGMRDALGLLDQVSVLGRSEASREITVEDVRSFIGVLEEDLLLALTHGILEKSPEQILGQIHFLQERGIEPTQMVKELTQHFRNLLIAKTCGAQASAEAFDISPDFYQKLCQQAQGFEVEELPQMLNRLSLMESQLRHSQQPQLWLEVGLLDLGYRQEIHLVKQLAERVDQLERMLSGGSIPVAAVQPPPRVPEPRSPQPSPVSSPPPVVPQQPVATAAPPVNKPMETSLPINPAPSPVLALPQGGGGTLDQIWQQILVAIPMPTQALVKQHFTLLEQAEEMLTIGYANNMIFETFKRDPRKSEQLEQAVQTVLGKSYKLNYQLSDAPPESKPMVAAAPIPEPVAVAAVSQPVAVAVIAEPVPMPETPVLSEPAPVIPQASVSQLTSVQSEIAEDLDVELQQVKKNAQEMLQGKLLD
jgi:DNA polymerase III subunit gamma/tau